MKFSPKSASSATLRISTSPLWNGIRRAHPIASSREATSRIQYPATSSLVSVNGPSTTVVSPRPVNFTRAPNRLSSSPLPSTITPAAASSSL